MPRYRCSVELGGSPWALRPVEVNGIADALTLLKQALCRYEHTTGISLINTEDGSQQLMVYEPECNLVTLSHREHPVRGDHDAIHRCYRSRTEMQRFAEDTLGSWEGEYWREHTDEDVRRTSREKVWDTFHTEYRARIRNWVISIRKRDDQSLRALSRMAARVRRAMPGIRTEIIGPNNGVTYRSALVPRMLKAKDADELAEVFISDITEFVHSMENWRRDDEPSIGR